MAELPPRRADQQSQASVSSAAQLARDQPRVYIVLLNWNGWQDTLECMRSLEQLEYENWHAVIVDNGSTDDSVERINEVFPELKILETHTNLGFAAGNNVGYVSRWRTAQIMCSF